MLQGRGIEVWGVMVLGGLVHLCVREDDALRAEYLLAWAGAPVVTVDERSIGWDDRETHTAPEWAKE